MNKGSSLITEYDTTDLSLVREIAWSGVDSDEEETHFEIHCGTELRGRRFPALRAKCLAPARHLGELAPPTT